MTENNVSYNMHQMIEKTFMMTKVGTMSSRNALILNAFATIVNRIYWNFKYTARLLDLKSLF